jgi:hypothetical protein
MMMRDDEGEKLRREIGRRESTRGRLHRSLRERCVAYAAQRSAEGASEKVIAAELGVSAMSVHRWLLAKRGAKVAALVPVRVIPPATQTASPAVITTPRGLRVEGLDLDAVCVIIARLG